MRFVKVLNKADEEVLAQEVSIHDDEYKLMKQCWKKQRKERITLVVLNEKLNEMRQKIKSGGYSGLKCLWNEKQLLLIWKAFQNTEEWRFHFWNTFLRFRDINVFVSEEWSSQLIFQFKLLERGIPLKPWFFSGFFFPIA